MIIYCVFAAVPSSWSGDYEERMDFCSAHKTMQGAMKCKQIILAEEALNKFEDEVLEINNNNDLFLLLQEYLHGPKEFDFNMISTDPFFIASMKNQPFQETMKDVKTEDEFWKALIKLYGSEEFSAEIRDIALNE